LKHECKTEKTKSPPGFTNLADADTSGSISAMSIRTIVQTTRTNLDSPSERDIFSIAQSQTRDSIRPPYGAERALWRIASA
jgi:hypothetical protein